jgi:hypothetical protein
MYTGPVWDIRLKTVPKCTARSSREDKPHSQI